MVLRSLVALLLLAACTGTPEPPPPPSDHVRGTVVDLAGKPLAGARVRLRGTVLGVRTAADGAFDLGPLPNAEFELHASLDLDRDGVAELSAVRHVRASASAMAIGLRGTNTWGARLLVGTAPLVAATVLAPDGRTATSDPAGIFTLRGVDSDTTALYVATPGGRVRPLRRLTVPVGARPDVLGELQFFELPTVAPALLTSRLFVAPGTEAADATLVLHVAAEPTTATIEGDSLRFENVDAVMGDVVLTGAHVATVREVPLPLVPEALPSSFLAIDTACLSSAPPASCPGPIDPFDSDGDAVPDARDACPHTFEAVPSPGMVVGELCACAGRPCEPCIGNSCAALGARCGRQPDGCGNLNNCGLCEVDDALADGNTLVVEHATASDGRVVVAPSVPLLKPAAATRVLVNAATASTTRAGGDETFQRIDLRAPTGTRAEWHVSGDWRLESATTVDLRGLHLVVDGDFTLVAGGRATLDCTKIEAAHVTLHVAGDEGLWLGCYTSIDDAGLVATAPGPGGSGVPPEATAFSPAIDVRTLGPLTVADNALLRTLASDGAASSGDVTLRTRAGLTIGPDATIVTDGGTSSSGRIDLASEGSLTVSGGAQLGSAPSIDGPPAAGGVRLDAFGSVILDDRADVSAGPGGALGVFAYGPVEVRNGSVLRSLDADGTPGDVTVEAASLRLMADAYVVAGGSSSRGAAAGSLLVRVRGDAGLGSDGGAINRPSSIRAGDARCGAGGTVRIEAGGNVLLADDSTIAGGRSIPASTCAAATGGAVSIVAAGVIDATGVSGPWFIGGAGVPTGALEITSRPDLLVRGGTPRFGPDARVTGPSEALASADGHVLEVRLQRTPPAWPLVSIELAPAPGADFVPWPMSPDRPLHPGWRWRVSFTPRLFDTSELLGVTVRHR